MSVVTIERKVLEKNEAFAEQNRRLFAGRGLFVINMVSSPGAGKTSLLDKTIQRLKGKVQIAVIEGDVQTDLDARRVEQYGVPVVQIVAAYSDQVVSDAQLLDIYAFLRSLPEPKAVKEIPLVEQMRPKP